MNYQLTPEQAAKNKLMLWKVLLFGFLSVLGILVFITYPSFSKGNFDPSKMVIVWGITLVLSMLGMFVGMSNARKKQTTQVQTRSSSFVLVSELKKDEIAVDSISQLRISSDPSGNVSFIFVKTSQQPYVLLRGFDNMNGLAAQLEKMVSDPDKVARDQVQVSPQKKALRVLGCTGLMAGITLLFIGGTWGLYKLGLGFLMMPLCFVSMGASRFIGNRRDRNQRMTGVGLIFLGVLWAVFEFVGILTNGK